MLTVNQRDLIAIAITYEMCQGYNVCGYVEAFKAIRKKVEEYDVQREKGNENRD